LLGGMIRSSTWTVAGSGHVQSIRLSDFGRVPPRSGPLATSTNQILCQPLEQEIREWCAINLHLLITDSVALFLCIRVQRRCGLPLTRWNGPVWEECNDCCEADINSCCGLWYPLFVWLAFSRLAGYGIERIKYYSPRCLFACSDWVVGLFLEGANSRWKSCSAFGF
jgi:hypothetical protein